MAKVLVGCVIVFVRVSVRHGQDWDAKDAPDRQAGEASSSGRDQDRLLLGPLADGLCEL